MTALFIVLSVATSLMSSMVDGFGVVPQTAFGRQAAVTSRVGVTFPTQPSFMLKMAESSLPTATTTPSDEPLDLQDWTPGSDEYQQKALNRFGSLDVGGLMNHAIIAGVVGLVVLKLTMVNADMSRGWTIAEVAGRIPLDIWRDYSGVLEQFPITTKAVTSASVYAIGDIIAQRTQGTDLGELDQGRVIRSLLAGLIGHGPMSHFWYNWCDSFFDETLRWTEWWSFFPKVILDQATWGPFWNNTYILLLGLMKLESWESMWNDMRRTTIPLVVSGLKLWPLAHCITYGLVPVENRLLWVDIVEILWVTILATQASGHSVDVAPEAAEAEVELCPQ